jgi:hypothetical protein
VPLAHRVVVVLQLHPHERGQQPRIVVVAGELGKALGVLAEPQARGGLARSPVREAMARRSAAAHGFLDHAGSTARLAARSVDPTGATAGRTDVRARVRAGRRHLVARRHVGSRLALASWHDTRFPSLPAANRRQRVGIVLRGMRDELRSSDRLSACLAREGVRPASAVAVERHAGG